MSLPIFTTAEDVRKLVGYLKTKPTGATISEAKAIDKTLFDPRKVSAYLSWNIAQRDGEKFKLSQLGWDMARGTKKEEDVFREILDSVHPYRAALEWVNHKKFEEVSNVDIAAHWHEHHSEHTGTDNENSIKDQAVCFMRIVEAAGLGAFVLGRKKQSTRVVVAKDQLSRYIEKGPSSPPWVEPPHQEDDITDDVPQGNAEEAESPTVGSGASASTIVPPASPLQTDLTVFISHGKNREIVEQVETMLQLANIKSEVAVKEETTAIPVPEKVFAAMRRCHAAIIVVAVEEARRSADGEYTVNENVLIEVGAAFVLYDKKVVLLWDKRLPIPSNLQGLYRCEFEGDEMNWSTGMKLMKAINGFKQ